MSRASRSTSEVLADHLRLRVKGALEEDLARNYADSIVLLTNQGVFHGKDGVRASSALLEQQVPSARIECRSQLVHGEIGFLHWLAHNDTVDVEDGADSFLIRDGLIQVQTIHYTVRPRSAGR